MKKRLLSITLALILAITLAAPLPSAAAQDISVEIDGKRVEFEGQQPVIVNGRTLVPVRGVFEQLGFEVTWETHYPNTATLISDDYTVHIEAGSTAFTVNEESYTLDVPAQLINGRTMLPIRAVLEAVGLYVAWDAVRQTVLVSEEPVEDVHMPVQTLPAPIDEVGSIIEFGGLKWRVLDTQGDIILILSEYIIAFQPYHHELADITWAESSIRRWLNNEFLTRFSVYERIRIAETDIINNDNPWYGTPGGADTVDRVFLLSLEEVVRFFGDSGQLQNRPVGAWLMISDQYDTNRVAYVAIERDGRDGQSAWWRLRSPGDVSSNAAGVNYYGVLWVFGHFVDSDRGGIRPAMWIYR